MRLYDVKLKKLPIFVVKLIVMKKVFALLFIISGIINFVFAALRFANGESNPFLLALFGVFSILLGVYLFRSENRKSNAN